MKNVAFLWYVYVENFVVYTNPWYFQLSYGEVCYNMRFQLQNEIFLYKGKLFFNQVGLMHLDYYK